MVPRSGLRIPSTHSIVVVFPAPFGPISPKISPSIDLERRFRNGHGFAVGFADSGDFDDWMHGDLVKSQNY